MGNSLLCGLWEHEFSSAYDESILVIRGIEQEGPSSSAATMATQSAAVNHPSGPSEISVKDLAGIFNKNACRRILAASFPKRSAGRRRSGNRVKQNGHKLRQNRFYRMQRAKVE